jgi:hypothetical protein
MAKKDSDAAEVVEERAEERADQTEENREDMENAESHVDREVTGASQGTSDVGSVAAKSGPETNVPDEEVVEALEETVLNPDEPFVGGIAPLEVQEAQVRHADRAYKLEEPGFGTADTTTVADLEARRELAGDSHREVENDELGSLAIDFDTLNSIRPDEKVQVVVRERTEDDANDFGIEDLEQERIVKDLAESGQLFDKGGPLVNWTHDVADLSDGVDGLFLAERSKQTGTKLF